MKAVKYLVVIVALVVVGGVIADSWAQCAPARLFRSSGKLGNNLDFDVTGTDNNGNQIGYFWDSDDANASNSGFAPEYGARCPIDQWWKERAAPARQIDGAQGGTGCAGAGMGCPANKMTIVVEDYAEGGPPGVGSTAFYAAYIVDETPASGRWYDYGNLDGITANNSIIPMLAYPDAVITGSSREGATIAINYNNLDQTNMVHSTDWAGGGGVYPTSAVISEWQLVKATGTADPGRLRSQGWVTINRTPYVAGGAPASFLVPCASTATDEYLAIAIGFNGGAFGVIDSALVGRAIPLECDSNIAQPDTPVEFKKKPAATQLESQPSRSGGRR